jgi:uncharacterized protein YkwD
MTPSNRKTPSAVSAGLLAALTWLSGATMPSAQAQTLSGERHPALAAALQVGANGDAVLEALNNIEPFEPSEVDRAYREQRFDRLLNLIRAEGGVCNDAGGRHAPNPNPIRQQPQLNTAAYEHARYLARERPRIRASGSPSSHSQTLTDSPFFTGRNMTDRARQAGYEGFTNGENFAGGNGNDAAGGAIALWLNSPAGHCSGLFSTDVEEFGFGAENYINDELNGNNEFKAIYMTGKRP